MSTRDDPAEVARAMLHRDRLARRAVAEQARGLALSGSRTARAALADAWAPIKVDRRYPELSPVPPPPYPSVFPLTY